MKKIHTTETLQLLATEIWLEPRRCLVVGRTGNHATRILLPRCHQMLLELKFNVQHPNFDLLIVNGIPVEFVTLDNYHRCALGRKGLTLVYVDAWAEVEFTREIVVNFIDETKLFQ